MSAWLLALAALQGALDSGTFVVRADTAELARETFRLSSARVGEAETRWRLASIARYDRDRPAVTLAPTLELGADSQPASLDYDAADPREPARILGQRGRGRLTVRTLGRGTERAREFPLAGPVVVLDDSVFALYRFVAWYARPEATLVTGVFPRAGRRESLTLQDDGVQPTILNHAATSLRHVTVAGGASALVHLWFDAAGRLLKVDIPSRRLTVERMPTA